MQKTTLANLQFFKRKTRYFTDVVYDKIIAFIKELRKDDEVLGISKLQHRRLGF
jgi:hypothetical protein